VADWVCILSPWLAFVGLIIWDTREKGFRSPLGVLRDVDPNRIVALGTLLLALGTFALAWVAAIEALRDRWRWLRRSPIGFHLDRP
jgi:hypothetical protein